MKISVVTISFNQAEFLRRCMDSVLGQGYPDLEYIVVDPGSTDGSRDIIDSYGDRVVRVYEKDSGAADGLNRGFARATGEVFAFINSDDELLPGSLQAMAEAFAQRPRAGALAGSGWFVDGEGKRLKRTVPTRLSTWRIVHGVCTVFQQGTFFRARTFRAVGGFNASNRTCWDGELFLDMALAGCRFEVIDHDIALFRLHAGSITGSGRLTEQFNLDARRLFKKAMGRGPNWWDRCVQSWARPLKFVLNPAYLLRRIR